jgi:hypothetical protein
MAKWIAFQLLVKNPFHQVSKNSVVTVNDEKYIVKRIDGVVLLDASVKQPHAVVIFARGIKHEEKRRAI